MYTKVRKQDLKFYLSTFSSFYNSNYENNFTDFTNKKLRLKTNKEDVDNSFEPTWKQSLATLGSYIDLLAPELFAVWEIREQVPVPIRVESHQKVLNWLESSTSNHRNTQSQDETKYTATPINTQELISVSQDQDLMYIDDSNILQDILLPKVKSKSTKRKGNILKY